MIKQEEFSKNVFLFFLQQCTWVPVNTKSQYTLEFL